MYDLYTTLKTLCEGRGISLAKMCLDLGMPKSTTTELKKGRAKTLSSTKITKIAEYFGVSVDYILGREVNGKTTIGPLSEEQEKLVSELIKTLPNNKEKTLSPEKINLLKKVVMLEDNEVGDVSTVLDILLAKKDEKK